MSDSFEGFDPMPQPLNRVIPDASFRHNPNILDDKPNLAKFVAKIFANWGLVEYRLSLLLVRVLGADAEPAIAMFSTLTAQHLQLGALEAAAQAALTPTEFDVFKAAMNVTDGVQGTRNRLAHWIWGACPELPDALLLAEPKAAKERDRELALALEQSDTGGLDTAKLAELNSYDSAKISVYREGDLERADRDIAAAAEITFLLVIYLDGLFRGRRKTPPGERTILREHVFHQLYGMLHLDGGRAMKRLVTEFEVRGYLWSYRVVNSLAFLPQRRERVFFVASRVADPADVLFVDDVEPRIPKTTLDSHAHGFYWTEGIRGLGWAPDAVPTIKNGSTIGIPAPPAVLMPDGEVVKPDIRDAERLQGFDAGWTKPAESVGRASWRWSLVGNAVTVPVAHWVGSRLADPGQYESSRDRELGKTGRWPRAARFDGDKRFEVEIGSHPTWKTRKSLHRFLKFPADLLSTRATAGFLKRTEVSTLRFVDGFRERIRHHLERMRSLDRALAVPAE